LSRFEHPKRRTADRAAIGICLMKALPLLDSIFAGVVTGKRIVAELDPFR
jgi:hypothetical protein